MLKSNGSKIIVVSVIAGILFLLGGYRAKKVIDSDESPNNDTADMDSLIERVSGGSRKRKQTKTKTKTKKKQSKKQR
jgi:hypothetical protein